jgi:uncharacterized protein
LSHLWKIAIEKHESIVKYSFFHGPEHWYRVFDNGMRICERTGADRTVVSLFAIFHDCCRVSDFVDGKHGIMAAKFVTHLINKNVIKISKTQKIELLCALRLHDDGSMSSDETIGACFDADRLDIGRTGQSIDINKLSTEYGKELAKYNLGAHNA